MGCVESKSERNRRELEERRRLEQIERERKRKLEQEAFERKEKEDDEQFIKDHKNFCEEFYIPLIKQWRNLQHQQPHDINDDINNNYTKIKSNKCEENIIKRFEYETDGDKNGIFYYLREKVRTFKSTEKDNYYKNTVGIINIEASSTDNRMASHVKKFCPGFRENKVCDTIGRTLEDNADINNKPYVILNVFNNCFGLRPTYYSIKGAHNKDILVNWNFEGSNNKINWKIIKSHKNDPMT
eukprot:197501_1